MGNLQPTGTSSKPTPPSTPRGSRSGNGLNFEATALGQTVHSMGSHAQGAPSPTITPLPPDATVSVLTPQQISALGPAITPRKQIVVGEIGCPPMTLTGKTATYTAKITGLELGSFLATAFFTELDRALERELKSFLGDDFLQKQASDNGIEIRFTVRLPSSAEVRPRLRLSGGPLQTRANKFHELDARVKSATSRTRNLFCNMLDLGLAPVEICKLTYNEDVRESLSNSMDWKLNTRTSHSEYQDEVKKRRECIKAFMDEGCFEFALVLLDDFVRDPELSAKFAFDHARTTLADGSSVIDGGPIFKSGENLHFRQLKALICVNRCSSDAALAGRIVLREILTTDKSSLMWQPYQGFVLKEISEKASRLDEAWRFAFLGDLLDLPGIDRGELFRNPKAKLFLSAFPELYNDVVDKGSGLVVALGPFHALEVHYQEIFRMRMKRLEEKFVFAGTSDQLEILARSPHAPISVKSIDLFLDLIDAATYCTGQVRTAIGALTFLASRKELSGEQKQKVVALCNQVKMAVRFDPDPEVTKNLNSVVTETDVILAAISAPGSRETKPDAEV